MQCHVWEMWVCQRRKMPAHTKQRKTDAECGLFNKTWTCKNAFTQIRGKTACLVCGELIVCVTITITFSIMKVSTHRQALDWCRVRTDIWTFASKAAKAARTFYQALHIQGWNFQNQFCDFPQNCKFIKECLVALNFKEKADSLVCFLLGSRWELWCSPHTSVTHLCTCGNERVWDYRGAGSNALSETDSDSKWIVHGGWKWTNRYRSQWLSKSDREKFQTFEVDARERDMKWQQNWNWRCCVTQC